MKQKYLILFSLCGFVVSLDQFTKYYVSERYDLGQTIWQLWGIRLSYLQNQGYAFGLFQHLPSTIQEIFFIGLPAFALVLILLIFVKLRDNQLLTSVALTTILAGAIGNLIDRIQFGYVIDFLEINFAKYLYIPPFNIADCSIMLGIIIMFVHAIRQERVKATP